MDFIEISVKNIDGEAAETIGELFNRYGHGGAVIDSYPPDFERLTIRTVIPGDDKLLLQQIEAMLALIGRALPNGLPEPQFQLIGESDWAESWKEHFHVVRIGQRLVIKPSWRDYQPTANDIVLELDPGMAFGSGLHPTTKLCLEILEQMPLSGQSLFDVGTGSGILTIAAAKLGASPIRAVDVDDVAVRVARENFVINKIDSRIETATGSANDNGGQKWQVIVANILAHTLVELMPDLAAALAPDGKLILSGIIAEQEASVITAIESHQLNIVERRIIDDWVALVGSAGRMSE